jgi:hypothetical protein
MAQGADATAMARPRYLSDATRRGIATYQERLNSKVAHLQSLQEKLQKYEHHPASTYIVTRSVLREIITLCQWYIHEVNMQQVLESDQQLVDLIVTNLFDTIDALPVDMVEAAQRGKYQAETAPEGRETQSADHASFHTHPTVPFSPELEKEES